jgi:hypothetical protein
MTPRIRVGLAAAGLGSLLALVGGIALVASYWHARALAHAYRSPDATIPDLSAWLPLTTDGLLFGAFAVIYWRRVADMTVPRLAWIGAALAGIGTVAANLATAHASVTGWIVAGWAPLTFTLVDFLVALLIPPLVKAWRDARDADDEPIPFVPADTPTLAMHAPVTPAPWTTPSDLTAWFSGTGPLLPTVPPDDWGTHPADVDDWEARAATDGFIVPRRPDPNPDRVSAADDRRPHVDTIWTEDDEQVRAAVQKMLDDGDLTAIPSGRWFRNNHGGMGSERAKRIIAQLRLPEGS